jgi:hypothetical protein
MGNGRKNHGNHLHPRAMITLFPLLLSGCFGWKPFQPPPTEFESWSKAGVASVEVKKAMLECGYPSPYEAVEWRPGVAVTQEEFALMYMCMKSNGFVFANGRYDFCAYSASLKACQSGAAIPKRDIGKRMNGSFCHAHSSDPVCY